MQTSDLLNKYLLCNIIERILYLLVYTCNDSNVKFKKCNRNFDIVISGSKSVSKSL